MPATRHPDTSLIHPATPADAWRLIARTLPPGRAVGQSIVLAVMLHQPDRLGGRLPQISPASFDLDLHQYIGRMARSQIRDLGTADLATIRRLLCEQSGFGVPRIDLELSTLATIANLIRTPSLIDLAFTSFLGKQSS